MTPKSQCATVREASHTDCRGEHLKIHLPWSRGQSQSYLTTDIQSANLCWCQAESEPMTNFSSSSWHSLWSTDPKVRVRFLALPDFLKSSRSGTGFAQPREYNWRATWKRNSGSGLEIREYGRRDPSRWPRGTLCPQKLELTLPTSSGTWVDCAYFFRSKH
jgi:hypothetical protein